MNAQDLIEGVIEEGKVESIAKEFVSEFKDDIKDGEDIESQVADYAKANGVNGDRLYDAVRKEIKKRGW